MQVTDTKLQVKRYRKKTNFAKNCNNVKRICWKKLPIRSDYLLKIWKGKLNAQASFKFMIMGVVRSYFCGQRTCSICNSIRLAKFLNKYRSPIESLPSKYHMVLSIKNPVDSNLKKSIDSMFKFFNQSSIKKNKDYRELNKNIKFIRSFETTFNHICKII